MNDDNLDRLLSRQEDIVPSSGFVSNVMEAVRHEASAPPPIPFPWKRALPGLAAWLIVLAAGVLAIFSRVDPGPVRPAGPAVIRAGWIALGLLAAFLSVGLSLRLAGGRN